MWSADNIKVDIVQMIDNIRKNMVESKDHPNDSKQMLWLLLRILDARIAIGLTKNDKEIQLVSSLYAEYKKTYKSKMSGDYFELICFVYNFYFQGIFDIYSYFF